MGVAMSDVLVPRSPHTHIMSNPALPALPRSDQACFVACRDPCHAAHADACGPGRAALTRLEPRSSWPCLFWQFKNYFPCMMTRSLGYKNAEGDRFQMELGLTDCLE